MPPPSLPALSALPPLSYPFAWQVSPFAAEVDEACYRWGEHMGLYRLGDAREYRETQVGWLAAYTCPRGTREGLQLLADWQMWLFAFDDGYCDESEEGARCDVMAQRVVGLLGIMEGKAEPAAGDPFSAGLADLSARLAGCAHGFQRSRFISAVRGYFLAQCWEAVHRAAGIAPGLGEYTWMRRHSGAVPTCTALSDVAGGYRLPAADHDHPDVTAVTDMAVNIACWANDILSYPKEAARSKVVHSLPAVLRHERNVDAAQALDMTARMHDQEVARYLEAERHVRAWAGPSLHRYLDDLRFWMSGNLRWSQHTGRYARGGREA
jgi:Terpene synthase family 2, C-terminal metal binding